MSELEREGPVDEPDEGRDAAEDDEEPAAPPPDYLDPKPMTPDGR